MARMPSELAGNDCMQRATGKSKSLRRLERQLVLPLTYAGAIDECHKARPNTNSIGKPLAVGEPKLQAIDLSY